MATVTYSHSEHEKIPLFKVKTPSDLGQRLQNLWEEGTVTEGERSDRFESMFGDFIKNPNVCLTNSGTSALDLAYAMLNIGEDDEIISSPMTCAATNEPLLHRKANIVWADIDPGTGNMSLDSLKSLVTNKTKAVVAVMWGGVPFDHKIVEFLRKKHIYLVIDAAHALGATWAGGKMIGEDCDENAGTVTIYSFQAIKHLTTGDGGAIAFVPFVRDEGTGWAERCRKLRWFGLSRKYKGSKWEQDIIEPGYKYHMNNMNAEIGILQMSDLPDLIERHKENAAYFDMYIQNPAWIGKPIIDYSKCSPSWWLYTLSLNNEIERNEFVDWMKKVNIDTDVVHVRNDKYSCFANFAKSGLENVQRFNDTHICIPVGWWLTKEQRKRIVDRVNEFKTKAE